MSKQAAKAYIDQWIYGNGEQKITGPILNDVLNTMVDEGGEGGAAILSYTAVPTLADLPAVGNPGVGYLVGTHLYLYVAEGGDTLGGLYQDAGEFKGPVGAPGAPGADGVGFSSITTNQDGTISIVLTSGDTITIDLNHEHPQYPKYVLLASESDMPASPDNDTLYLIPVTE